MSLVRAATGLGLAGSGAWGFALYSEDPKQWLARRDALVRGSRLASTVALVAAEHLVAQKQPDKSSLQLQQLRRELEQAQVAQERAGVALEQALGRSGGAQPRDVHPLDSTAPRLLEEKERAVAAAKEGILLAAAAVLEAEAAEGSASSRLHDRNAQRLVAMARLNGGCYLKIAQHVAQLGHLLPPEYITHAQTCLDACPLSSLDDVRAVIAEDLGAPPEELWESFSPVPVASASLAQVHVATERGTGRKLAVKVMIAWQGPIAAVAWQSV